MTKTVLFYARYSTDRQNEVSIEAQVELGKTFAAGRVWALIETYTDSAISGTYFTSRPGILCIDGCVIRGVGGRLSASWSFETAFWLMDLRPPDDPNLNS